LSQENGKVLFCSSVFLQEDSGEVMEGKISRRQNIPHGLKVVFFPIAVPANSVIVFASRLLKETRENPTPAHCSICPNFQSDEGITL